MSSQRPTELAGEKLRKAIDEFCELIKNPDTTRSQAIEKVSRKFDLSPKECDFLIRQLSDK